MIKSDSITKIAPAFIAFNSKVHKISKDAANPFHKNKYATLDQIIDEVRPILNESKLAIMQDVSGEEGTMTVKTVLIHESGEWMESNGTTLKLAKNDPQGAGAGITYARRYDLCAFLSLNTGEDDDGNSASGINGQSKVSGNKASEKQLNLVNKLLNGKAADEFNYDQLHQGLKTRLNTTADIENWTSSQASQAIKILQGDK